MSGLDFLLCPECQKQNSIIADTCVYCGASLERRRREPISTKELDKGPELETRAGLCEEHLKELPSGALALVVIDEDEPIVVPNPESIVLGRIANIEDIPNVDISLYSNLGHGISRKHARITKEQGKYMIEDLGSTNGTWVNRQRLMPGKPHELHSGDMVVLGAFPLTVCFHTD